VHSLQFIDAANKVIVDITGWNIGKVSTLNLEEGEDIVGIQARESNGFINALGFMTITK